MGGATGPDCGEGGSGGGVAVEAENERGGGGCGGGEPCEAPGGQGRQAALATQAREKELASQKEEVA